MNIQNHLETKGYTKVNNFISDKTITNIINQWQLIQEDPSADLRNEKFIKEPVVSVYVHKLNGKKKLLPLSSLPSILSVLNSINFKNLFNELSLHNNKITLLETIIFDKPPKVSGDLHWHQDTSYFPLLPLIPSKLWFITFWIALDDIDEENGAMQYFENSHSLGELASVDLNTGLKYRDDDDRLPISDIKINDKKVFSGIVNRGDVLIHNGLTLHKSLKNISLNRNRRALAFKFLLGDILFKPRPGISNLFIAEKKFIEDEKFESICYPKYENDNFLVNKF